MVRLAGLDLAFLCSGCWVCEGEGLLLVFVPPVGEFGSLEMAEALETWKEKQQL